MSRACGFHPSFTVARGVVYAFWLLLPVLMSRAAEPKAAARKAWVISNAGYRSAPTLKNPPRDAALLAASLHKTGFTLTLTPEADAAALQAAEKKFLDSLKEGDVAVIHYSGHGVQIRGENYLLPIDFNPAKVKDLHREALAVGDLLADLDRRKVSLKLLFLDCCRDTGGLIEGLTDHGAGNTATAGLVSSERTRGMRGSGLAEVNVASEDTLVCFATKHGMVAQDNDDLPASRYSSVVAEEMLKPGLKVEDMMKLVAIRVSRDSGGQQRPFTYGHLLGFFYFVPDRSSTGSGRDDPLYAVSQAEAIRLPGTEMTNHLGMTLCWCPAGQIVLGSPEQEEGREAQEKVFHAHLSRGYWMGKNEVSQEEWETVTGHSLADQARRFLKDDTLYLLDGKPTTLRDWKGLSRDTDPHSLLGVESPRVPIYYVNWEESVEFCEKLTVRERAAGTLPAGWQYRLPTEAEWEYACRAGSTGALYSGPLRILGELDAPDLDTIAWYGGNSSAGYDGRGWDTHLWPEKQYPGGKAGPRRAGLKRPNAWGLHDMLGNVWEWCWDWRGEHPQGAARDWAGPAQGTERILRGGSWISPARSCRCATRYAEEPTLRSFDIGFRIVLSRSALP